MDTAINKVVLSLRFSESYKLTLLDAVLFLLIPFINLKINRRILIILVICIHLFDLYSYKFFEVNLRSFPLTHEEYNAITFQPLLFDKRREEFSWYDHPKAELIKTLLDHSKNVGAYYTMTSFLLKDFFDTPWRTDQLQAPLSNYLNAYWGKFIRNISSTEREPLPAFPTYHPAIKKISGVTEDKIQFFSDALFINQKRGIASMITAPDYTGDILFLSSPEGQIPLNSFTNLAAFLPRPISNDSRLYLPYKILRYDSNHLEVKVQIPTEHRFVWMMYSDVWRPQWKALINGKLTSIFQSNLAYKAVLLNSGNNHIHFYFQNNLLKFLQTLVSLNALVWLIIYSTIDPLVLSNNQ